jgi:type II secretory pathway pseudopilin PulG
MNAQAKASRFEDETGFGLIEIVISMFLLGLLAIAFLPLLVTSIRTTVVNSTTATATQLVEQQLEQARSAGDTCAVLTVFGSVTPPTVTDSRGVKYQPTRTVGGCSVLLTDYPRTVSVKVTVSMVGSAQPPVTATTLVYLRAP